MPYLADEDFFHGRLKLRHLAVALVVAEEGSTVAAAKRLYVSQPAVTRAIHDLEDILGVPLFERTPSGMRPTEMAEPFVEHARAALSHIRRAHAHVGEMANGTRGRVVVGVHLAGANLLLPRAIGALKAERSFVEVVVREGPPDELFRRVATGDIDLMVTRVTVATERRRVSGEDLRVEALYDEPFAVVCGTTYDVPHSDPLRLADLADAQWVLPLRSTALRRELEAAFARARLEMPARTVECTSVTTVSALVAESGFIGVLPATLAAASGGLRTLDVVDCCLTSGIGVVWAEDMALTPTSTAMLDHLRRAAQTVGDAQAPVRPT